MNGQWHLPAELMEHYVTGHLEPAQVMSVESHLAGCARCRAAVPYSVEWLDTSWAGIEDVVDRPRPRPLARLLRRAGVPEHVAVFLAATPALARGWLVAIASTLAFAVGAGQLAARHPGLEPYAMLPFLAVAPVLPLAGVALAYGRHVDPVYELQAATPMAGVRSLLLRAVAVLTTAVVLTGLAAPLLPGPPGLAAAWLLPALALTVAMLALSTWVSPPISASVFGAGWVCAVVGGEQLAFSLEAQIGYALAALILIPLVYLRRARFDPGEPVWN
ncbi:zf-HC2 domain-containing protein [Nonomuraea sp. NPDC050786]|uniref:zf-HC2 domain-containing protein n=1 Tax=Nonomuraea sp. NPDC050786 TaxID=3154840 RepID=UPI0033F20505